MYDLLLKGGTLLDPASGVQQALDVGVGGGKVQAIASNIAPSEAARVISVRGCYVTPGLIDLHTHVAAGITQNGVDPDIAGVYSGVCTVVDAGSGGSHTFSGMARYVIPQAKTRVLAMVHIGRTGLAHMPELRTREDIDVPATIAAIQAHRSNVLGVKIRLVGPGVRDMGAEAVHLAKQATTETGTRLMVHIGDPDSLVSADTTRQMLRLVQRGDIVTHFFTGNTANLLDSNGRVYPEVREALDAGVTLDAASGRMNFTFDAARRILDQGFRPHCISTDITIPGRHTLVGSLTEVMSRFLALGFSLEDVVRMTTINTAKAIGMEASLGALALGREADISVLKLVDGDFAFSDSNGATLKGQKGIMPVLTVRAGLPMPIDFGPRPNGWLPAA
ncbi:MAG: amidohydrolase/deacetylase family metallohydrolase [Chloroflexi bacterium]|nr:amidohydrolase/deacetylase family metallohydrolase [Chloroflexota bacterium]